MNSLEQAINRWCSRRAVEYTTSNDKDAKIFLFEDRRLHFIKCLEEAIQPLCTNGTSVKIVDTDKGPAMITSPKAISESMISALLETTKRPVLENKISDIFYGITEAHQQVGNPFAQRLVDIITNHLRTEDDTVAEMNEKAKNVVFKHPSEVGLSRGEFDIACHRKIIVKEANGWKLASDIVKQVIGEDATEIASNRNMARRLYAGMKDLGLDQMLKDSGIANRITPDQQSVVFYDNETNRELYAIDLRDLDAPNTMAEHLDKLNDLATGAAPGASQLVRDRIRDQEQQRQKIAKKYSPERPEEEAGVAEDFDTKLLKALS